jgi:hypothetical protein
MLKSKVCSLGLLLSMLLLISGGGMLFWPTLPRTQAAGVNNSKLKALLKERLVALQGIASEATKGNRSGNASLAKVHEANQAVQKAELDLCDTDKERITVLENMVTDAKDYESQISQLVKGGVLPSNNSLTLKAKVDRLEVEIALERVKGK